MLYFPQYEYSYNVYVIDEIIGYPELSRYLNMSINRIAKQESLNTFIAGLKKYEIDKIMNP